MLWVAELPGEALTGLAVAEPVLAAVVVGGRSTERSRATGHQPTRSRIVALSTADGAELWARDATSPLGIPIAKGRVFVAPIGAGVAAFRTDSGREAARIHVDAGAGEHAPLDRLLRTDDGTVILGGGNHFVNLESATAGHAPAPQHIDTGYGVLFPDVGGMDRGYDDKGRLQLAIAFADSGEAPRAGVLLSRRAVVSLRFSPDGRPLRCRWVIHDRTDPREFVAMSVGAERVTLVREDGAIVEYDAATGAFLHAWAGIAAADGALLLDLDNAAHSPAAGKRAGIRTPRSALIELLDDDDERLLPAQILALELLWRSDDAQPRAIVGAVATGALGSWKPTTAQRLVQRAVSLRGAAWGSADRDELSKRLDHIGRRASYLADRTVRLAEVAGEIARSGTPDMLDHLVAHLLHPATSAEDLVAIVNTLSTLGGAQATGGLIAFVRLYHADPEIVAELAAVGLAVDGLAALATHTEAWAGRAQGALEAMYEDPFTAPDLRARIRPHVLRSADPPQTVSDPPVDPPNGVPGDLSRVDSVR